MSSLFAKVPVAVSRMERVKDTYCAVWFFCVHSAFNKRKQPYVYDKPLLNAMASCHKPCQETNSFCCILQVGTKMKSCYMYAQYSQTCVKWSPSERHKIGFQDQLSLNEGQKPPLEHSDILSTFIKLPFVIKSFVCLFFAWPFYTGFTVYYSY